MLLAVLLVCAVIIVVAVVLQKSNEGLSGTIAGGSETYYGKDKAASKEKIIGKWMLIVSIIFAVAVIVVYVIQPDYANYEDTNTVNAWQTESGLNEFSSIFTTNDK